MSAAPATTSRTTATDATPVLRALARLGLDVRLDRLDPSVERAVRALWLDSVGCALAARAHPVVQQATRAAAMLEDGAAITALGSGRPLGLLGAMLDSGAAIRALDYNDFYWGPGIGGHPSDLFAVSLALAEQARASTREMLEASAAGYELYLRMLDLMEPHGAFDHTSAMTPAAALIAARLWRLDEEATIDALAMAFVRGPAMGAMRHGAISQAKATAPAVAGQGGVMAALLARSGIGGPRAACLGPLGLAAWVRDHDRTAALAEADGFGSALLRVSIKRFCCIGTAQSAVAAAREVHRKASGRRIEAVHARLGDTELMRHQTSAPYRRPASRETADHSFFALLAMTLCDGDLVPAQFDGRRWLDPAVVALSERFEFDCSLPIERQGLFSAQLRARLEDGSTVIASVDHPPGHPLAPLSPAELLAKWHACSAVALGGAERDRLSDAALHGGLDTPLSPWLAQLRTAASQKEFVA